MLQVAGLPIDTTQSDLEELFSDYGKIKIIDLEIKNDESVALIELDNNQTEKKARDDLDRKLWRGTHSLRVDIRRGKGLKDDQVRTTSGKGNG
ncbi:MAG: hypothetical protein WBA07_07915 [Rivularia sp. (in: cyanobacteria)]